MYTALGTRIVRPISTPGVYHNATLGLISLSGDGENWITIADKNLGATEIYNDGDVLSEANCGSLYQWGNNFGFAFAGGITKIAMSLVDAEEYGPTNPFSNEYYRYRTSGPFEWDLSNNKNLRGGITDTAIARKGPCQDGFHIPSKTEWENLLSAIGTNDSTIFSKTLMIPKSGWRMYDSANIINGRGTDFAYWTSDALESGQVGEHSKSYYTGTYVDYLSGTVRIGGDYRIMGFSIRPFKDEAVRPDSTWTRLSSTILLSYEEIIALGVAQNTYAIDAELNKYPEEYFNKFQNEGYMDGGPYIYGLSLPGVSPYPSTAYIVSEKRWNCDV